MDEIERLEAMTVKERELGLRRYYEGLLCDSNTEITRQRGVMRRCAEVLRGLRPRRGWIEKLREECVK